MEIHAEIFTQTLMLNLKNVIGITVENTATTIPMIWLLQQIYLLVFIREQQKFILFQSIFQNLI